MLEVVVALVIIALIALFIRAGRQNTVVYRKRVASRDRDYPSRDQPLPFSQTTPTDPYPGNEPGIEGVAHDALAFHGGEFGGAGAGDSYDLNPTDPTGNDFNNFDAVAADFNDSVSNESDFSCGDSGTDDSGSSDSGSDSSSDCSGSGDD